MPAKIEQIIHSGMNTQESLRLLRRLETAHTPFSHTSRLVRKLCRVICILGCIVQRFRDEVSMRNAGTTKPRINFISASARKKMAP
jgi:hypothetical protein